VLRTYPPWLWPNLLSLDAPLVAVVWQGLIAHAFDVPLAWPARATLALAVWAVYIADRLLDAAHDLSSRPAPRHRFHREHRKAMTVCLAVALASAVALSVLQVRPALFRAGLLTGSIVLLYLAVVHDRDRLSGWLRLSWVSKEAVVAFLFTVGTILAPWLRGNSKGALLLAGAALFPVCWGNTSLIESFEWRRLRYSAGARPHASTVGIAERYAIYSLLVMCWLALIFLVWPVRELRTVLVAALLATFGLFLLDWYERRVSPAAFPVLADTALLSPIFFWAASWLQ
jgi:hypothetical protein